MNEPICQEERLNINEREWAPPCGQPATEQIYGRLVCQEHREFFEANEHESLAETICEDVPLEDLRRIADAGGLKPMLAGYLKLVSFLQDVPTDRLVEIDAAGGLRELLASHAQLVNACNLALPFLWNAPLDGAIEMFERVQFARNAGLPFHNQEVP